MKVAVILQKSHSCPKLQNPILGKAEKNLLPGEKSPSGRMRGGGKHWSQALTHHPRRSSLSRKVRVHGSIMDFATPPCGSTQNDRKDLYENIFYFKKSLRIHLIKISYFTPVFTRRLLKKYFLLQCPTIQGVCETWWWACEWEWEWLWSCFWWIVSTLGDSWFFSLIPRAFL